MIQESGLKNPAPFISTSKTETKTTRIMLYVNGELLNTGDFSDQNKHEAIVADYHKTIKYVKEYYGDNILVQTKIRPRSDAKTGSPRFPGPRGLLLISNMKRQVDGGVAQEELRYSPVILSKDDKGNLKHEDPNMLIHRGEKSISVVREPDLVYYVMKCGKVGVTPAEGRKFSIYDAKAINKEGASKRRAEGRVIHLIYDAIPEHEVRILAKSWGLGGVDSMGIETVRETLFDKVEEGEKTKARQPGSKARGFKEFAESSTVKEVDRLTALCKDAEEKKSLVFNKEDRTWVIDYKDKGKPYTLKELSGGEFGDPLGALVSHLMTDPSALNKVENVTGKKLAPLEPAEEVAVPRMDPPRYTPQQIFEEKRVPTLKKMLKEMKPDIKLPTTLKGEDVRRMLLEAIATESVQEAQG